MRKHVDPQIGVRQQTTSRHVPLGWLLQLQLPSQDHFGAPESVDTCFRDNATAPQVEGSPEPVTESCGVGLTFRISEVEFEQPFLSTVRVTSGVDPVVALGVA